MLNPNSDRLYYGNILSPPEDYHIDFAIGTTYSLDLDSLVGASISIDLSDDMDSNLVDNPIFLLDELRKTSDNIAIFCECGQIHLPSNRNPLYILLENVVFQVTTTNMFRNNRYSSFHPKFWLLKYKDKNGEFLYRFIVLSRNLTFDRSWDISFSMDGHKSENLTDKNNPIIDFINYLIGFTTDAKKIDKMKEIMDELRYVHFDLDSRIFNDFEFVINGMGSEYSIQNHSLFGDNLNELLIVSPFLSKDIINSFNNRMNSNSKALLFTRLASLSRLKVNDCDKFEIYTLKDEIIDGESNFSEDLEEKLMQDIHAKIYFIENKRACELYLGSLNASHNSFWGNIEFVIKLIAKKNKINVNQIADDLFNGDKDGSNNPFQIINIENLTPEESNEESSFDLVIKYISHLNSKAKVIAHDENYDIKLEFENIDYNKLNDVSVFIKPLLSNREYEFGECVLFNGLSKIMLSEFYIITVKDELDNSISRVIKVKTECMPEDRQKEIVSSIITDKTAFIRYVAFLLGDDYIISAIENENIGKSSKGISFDFPELYEKMLKAACYSPEKFDEIEFLVSALSEKNVIPEGFKELYNTFIKVID